MTKAAALLLAIWSPAAIPAAAPVLTTLYSFKGGTLDGLNPASALVPSGGKLVGVTTNGGIGCEGFGCGIVFSLTPPQSPGGKWTEEVIYSFTGLTDDGYNPVSITSGPGGILYGTSGGGVPNTNCPSGCGIVFSLSPPQPPGSSWTKTTLYSFAGPPNDGRNSASGVVLGEHGILYGTTGDGGEMGNSCAKCGIVFSLSPPKSPGGQWVETVLHKFAGSPNDGQNPSYGNSLVIDSHGVLYGLTPVGGSMGMGVVYSLTQVYLVLGNSSRIGDLNTLVDVGQDPAVLASIEQAPTGVGKWPVEQVVLTHDHYDHTALLSRVREAFHPKVFAFSPNIHGVDCLLRDGDAIKMGDEYFEVIHTPGHSSDSICLYNKTEGVLFAGDTPVVNASSAGTYEPEFLAALEKVCARDVRTIYFGHGPPLTEHCNARLRESQKMAAGNGGMAG